MHVQQVCNSDRAAHCYCLLYLYMWLVQARQTAVYSKTHGCSITLQAPDNRHVILSVRKVIRPVCCERKDEQGLTSTYVPSTIVYKPAATLPPSPPRKNEVIRYKSHPDRMGAH